MESIHNFQTNLIAFWRPQKHSYYALRWTGPTTFWRRWNGTVEGGLSKHKSANHALPGNVEIKLSNNTMLRVRSEGEFLLLGTTRITIVKRVSGATIPNLWKNYELGPLIEREGVDLAVSLWDLQAAVAVPPAPIPLIPIPPVVGNPPLPKRIAWLIAEDSAKNEEKCPITMEPISPITASVTSCYHTFDTHAIQAWLTNHTTCPQCRSPCVATIAFE